MSLITASGTPRFRLIELVNAFVNESKVGIDFVGVADTVENLISHQHTRVPEVQTTGDTTPVQQIVYAVSLTTSGGSNA